MKLNTNFHVPTALKTAQHLEEDTCSPGMLLKLQALLLLYQHARSLRAIRDTCRKVLRHGCQRLGAFLHAKNGPRPCRCKPHVAAVDRCIHHHLAVLRDHPMASSAAAAPAPPTLPRSLVRRNIPTAVPRGHVCHDNPPPPSCAAAAMSTEPKPSTAVP